MSEKYEQIIEAVKAYPILYDHTHIDHRNVKLKNKVWDILAEMLNEKDGEHLKTRWRNLRDSYSKHLRSLNNDQKIPAKYLERYKTWPWAKQLSFLQMHSENLIQTSVMQNGAGDIVDDVKVEPSFEQETLVQTVGCEEVEDIVRVPHQQEVYQLSQPDSNQSTSNLMTGLSNQSSNSRGIREPDATPSNQPTNIRRRESQVDKVLEYLKTRNRVEYDENDLIFLGYSKSIKKMSLQQQATVKYNIAKIIMEAEMKHAEEMANVQVLTNNIIHVKDEPKSPVDITQMTNKNSAVPESSVLTSNPLKRTEIKIEMVTDTTTVDDSILRTLDMHTDKSPESTLSFQSQTPDDSSHLTEGPSKKIKTS